VEIVSRMWSKTPASFQGQYYHIEDAYCEPKPSPMPPIMIGGGGEKLTLRVVAKHADWWNFPGGTLENYAHKLDVLREHCETVGRDYDEIIKTWTCESIAIAETEEAARAIAEANPLSGPHGITGTPEQVVEQLQPFIDLGVEYFIVRFADFPNSAGAELFAETVISQF